MTRSSKRLLAASLALMLAACAAAPMHTLPPPRNIAAPAAAPAAPADNSAAAEHRFRDALALMKDQQVDEAIAAFTALDHDFPAYSGAATNLGILYARRQQLARARGWFERAAAQNPRNVVALSWLGSTRRALGDFPGAEAAYQRALSVQPDYAPAHLDLGLLYELSLHRPQDALAQYRAYLRCAPARNPLVEAWARQLESPAAATAVAQRN